MKIAILGAQRNLYDSSHWAGIRWAMNELDLDYYEIDVQIFNKEQVLKEVHDYKPDLLIYGLTDPFYQDYYKELRADVKGKIAWWYADYKDDQTGNAVELDLRKYVDYVLISNDAQKDYWKKKVGIEAHFVACAGIPVDEIQFNPEYDADIVFIGGVHNDGFLKPRGDLMREIEVKSNLKIINGTSMSERMEIYREMPKIYGSAKICLDISHIWHAEKYTSNRYYVIANCGGFSLCKRFPGCEELYPTGIGKIYFDTVDEFLELKDYYLAHPEEREEIRKKGLEHSRKYHTYVNRIKEILKICEITNEKKKENS